MYIMIFELDPQKSDNSGNMNLVIKKSKTISGCIRTIKKWTRYTSFWRLKEVWGDAKKVDKSNFLTP